MAKDEQIVLPTTPMPRGYTFVRKGNVYITAHCRRATHAEGRVVYVVVRNLSQDKTILGLRCPQHIVTAVRAAEQATRTSRHAATDKRDTAQAKTFRAALLARYPAVPADTVPRIVQHAMQKHSGRVARTGTLDLAARVRLAVRAHIRHCWTDYEALLRERRSKETSKTKTGKGKTRRRKNGGKENERLRAEVRALTVERVDAIEREWAGGLPIQEEAKTTKEKRKHGQTKLKKKAAQTTRVRSTAETRPTRRQPAVAGSKKETAIVIDSDDDGEDDHGGDVDVEDEDDSDYDNDSYSDDGIDEDSDSDWT
ncbi:hypothetical protein SBRCBS47491_008031 [Sporothrix bragantina]|uniref:DUF2293 domain-containing protein n=1 Tax=Sporothrix bragantina TaxID=671064 RepID=A0ABP0CI12_9PEZI